MKVAIPYWQGLLSPVLDVARNLLIVDVENGREIKRVETTLNDFDSLKRAQQISGLGAEIVICGAISEPFEVMLQSAGVRVISNVCGRTEDVLNAFLRGALANSSFLMPGCNNQRRRHRQRYGRKH